MLWLSSQNIFNSHPSSTGAAQTQGSLTPPSTNVQRRWDLWLERQPLTKTPSPPLSRSSHTSASQQQSQSLVPRQPRPVTPQTNNPRMLLPVSRVRSQRGIVNVLSRFHNISAPFVLASALYRVVDTVGSCGLAAHRAECDAPQLQP